MSKVCEVCGTYLRTRHTTKSLIPLVNITKEQLTKLSWEDLELIKDTAKRGQNVCARCLQECHNDFMKCFDQRRGKIMSQLYSHRLIENAEVIKAVEEEQRRRWNVAGVKGQVSGTNVYGHLFPSVPTHEPK